jgi:hypothetical protein
MSALTISEFDALTDQTPKPRAFESFSALAAYLTEGPRLVTSKEAVRLWGAATFEPAHRRKENARSLALAPFDVEGLDPTELPLLLERLERSGVPCVVYTSHSHGTPEKMVALRIVFALASEVPGERWKEVWRAIQGHFEFTADRATSDASRILFHYSAHPDRKDQAFARVLNPDGAPLDWTALTPTEDSPRSSAPSAGPLFRIPPGGFASEDEAKEAWRPYYASRLVRSARLAERVRDVPEADWERLAKEEASLLSPELGRFQAVLAVAWDWGIPEDRAPEVCIGPFFTGEWMDASQQIASVYRRGERNEMPFAWRRYDAVLTRMLLEAWLPKELPGSIEDRDFRLYSSPAFLEHAFQTPQPLMLADPFVPADSLIFVVSEAGSGKSWLMLDMAAQALKVRHGVLFISGEDSARGLGRRIRQMDALRDIRKPWLSFLPEFLLDDPDWVTALINLMQREGIRLLLLDNLMSLASSDLREYDAAKKLMGAAERIRRSTGAAVVIAHHANKESKGAPSKGAAFGSTMFAKEAHLQLHLRLKTDKPNLLVSEVTVVKPRALPDISRTWELEARHTGKKDDPKTRTTIVCTDQESATAKSEEHARRVTQLQAWIAGHPDCTQADILKGLGGNEKATTNLLASLVEQKRVLSQKQGRAFRYRLPESTWQAAFGSRHLEEADR